MHCLWECNLVHFQKLKESIKTEYKHTLSYSGATSGYIHKRNADIYSTKYLYKNDHSSTICNSQNWKHLKDLAIEWLKTYGIFI